MCGLSLKLSPGTPQLENGPGVQNAAGNLGGVVSPLVTGLIVSRTHSFFLAFACAAVALLIAAGAYLFLVGDIAPLTWQRWDKKYGLIE